MLQAPPARVLIVRPSALGDVCRTVPVLASLRRAWPGSRIDWLVQDSFAGAVAAHPGLTGGGGVVPFPRSGLAWWWLPGSRGSRRLRELVRGLRGARYDVVIDAQGLLRSGLLTLATGAAVRVGHADAREGGWIGYTRRVDPRGAVHTVDRMLTLVGALGVEAVRDLRLFPSAEDLAAVDADRSLWGEGTVGRGLAVLAPTSRWAGKRWPIERFAELARRLPEIGVSRVAVVGTAGEREQCGPLLELSARAGSVGGGRVVDLVGRTSVGRLLALIARSDLVVGNDSAALHMAVGMGRPMVALYGPTDAARVGPYGRNEWVVQHVRPGERLEHKDEAAGRAMMERITVEEVVERAGAALRGVR